MRIAIELLGMFRPPTVSCCECKVRQYAQGADLIFRIKVGVSNLDLCDRHVRELVDVIAAGPT